VVDGHPAVGLAVQAARGPLPVGVGVVGEGDLGDQPGLGHRVRPTGDLRQLAGIAPDAGQTFGLQLGPDVVQDDGGHSRRMPSGQPQGDEAAERGAQDERPAEPEIVEHARHVVDVGVEGVGVTGWIPRRSPASPEVDGHHEPIGGQRRRHRLEVAAVAGEPGDADDRQSIGRFPVDGDEQLHAISGCDEVVAHDGPPAVRARRSADRRVRPSP
jgi:hypothetical protein